VEIKTVKLVYFSPTQTTEKVLKTTAKGMGIRDVRNVNLTFSDASSRSRTAKDHDAHIFGAPVYGGRLPALAVKRISQIKGSGTPAVVVAVYGNRAYDDALLELRDLVRQNGFVPVAGAAFIGEHSFSDAKTPIAKGRPDRRDLEKAKRFGASVIDKLKDIDRLDSQPPLHVPGKFPYQPYMAPSGISPETDSTLCSLCEACFNVCPTGAIRMDNEIITDAALCIVCCACVKECPNGARMIEAPRIQKIAQWLNANCRDRKEPEIFV